MCNLDDDCLPLVQLIHPASCRISDLCCETHWVAYCCSLIGVKRRLHDYNDSCGHLRESIDQRSNLREPTPGASPLLRGSWLAGNRIRRCGRQWCEGQASCSRCPAERRQAPTIRRAGVLAAGPTRTQPAAPGDDARRPESRWRGVRVTGRGHRLHDASWEASTPHLGGLGGVRARADSGTGHRRATARQGTR